MIYSRLKSLWWFPSATAHCWASYRHARNEVIKLLRKAEVFYSKERFAESKDCKSFRKTVSDAFGKHRPGKIEALKGTKKLRDFRLHSFFRNVGNNLADRFPTDCNLNLNLLLLPHCLLCHFGPAQYV